MRAQALEKDCFSQLYGYAIEMLCMQHALNKIRTGGTIFVLSLVKLKIPKPNK